MNNAKALINMSHPTIKSTLMFILGMFFCAATYSDTHSPDTTYRYEETKRLVQILPDNRATIYENLSERGGLTIMLQLVGKYTEHMEKFPGEYPLHTMSLHFFADHNGHVLYAGEFWIGDGENLALTTQFAAKDTLDSLKNDLTNDRLLFMNSISAIVRSSNDSPFLSG